MKLTINTDKLADAAQWALRAVPGNPPTPVLAGMQLEAADDHTLTLAGFDYYPSARARADTAAATPRRSLATCGTTAAKSWRRSACAPRLEHPRGGGEDFFTPSRQYSSGIPPWRRGGPEALPV